MAFIYELKNNPQKSVKTGLIGLLFIALGIFTSALGPALLDLQLLSDTTISRIAFLLPVRSFGYAVGSVIAGILGDMVDHQPLIIGSTILMTTSMFLFPLFSHIYMMYVLIALAGISSGCIDCIGNCWIIHIWGKENPPFMQIIHFMYGLGALIAPFLVEPFLLNKEADDLEMHSSNSTILADVASDNHLMIHWPFIIGSTYCVLVLALVVLNYILYPHNPVHPSRLRKNENKRADECGKKDKFQLNEPLSGKLKIMIIVIASVCMHAYVGLEISFGSLLTPFAVKSDLNLTKSQGSFITGSYWATYTFLRIFTLVLIVYLPCRTLLIGNFIIIMFSNCILVPFANNHEWALWVGSSLMGLGCSSVFATMFGFVEQLTPITARITAGFMVAACAGEFVIPLVVSQYLDGWPPIFLWIVLLYSTIAFACVIGLVFLQYKLLTKQKFKPTSS
ncbi:hypothetical protein HA402_011363 [Bradysia odoriphaga]|nr:hypothetical protein HA402_011363 [Bradysia odoriphaga]